MQEPLILEVGPILLIGQSIETSLSSDETKSLWQSFKSNIDTIKHRKDDDFYSITNYNLDLNVMQLQPNAKFEKWAAVEVLDTNYIPKNMSTMLIERGLYAKFVHRGSHLIFHQTMQYVFGTWMPNSQYKVDNRPHFEIIKPDYKLNDAAAVEDIYVPIKLK